MHRRASGHDPAPGVTPSGTQVLYSPADEGVAGPGSPGGPDLPRPGVVPRPWWRRPALAIPDGLLLLLAVVYGVDLLLSRGEVPRNTVVSGVEIGGLAFSAAAGSLEQELAPTLDAEHTIVAADVSCRSRPRRVRAEPGRRRHGGPRRGPAGQPVDPADQPVLRPPGRPGHRHRRRRAGRPDRAGRRSGGPGAGRRDHGHRRHDAVRRRAHRRPAPDRRPPPTRSPRPLASGPDRPRPSSCPSRSTRCRWSSTRPSGCSTRSSLPLAAPVQVVSADGTTSEVPVAAIGVPCASPPGGRRTRRRRRPRGAQGLPGRPDVGLRRATARAARFRSPAARSRSCRPSTAPGRPRTSPTS